MTSRSAFCSVAFLFLSSFAGAAEMKLMSFNVCHCSGMDGKIDIARTAGRIRAEDPDFVCLQELDWYTARSGVVDQPAELGRLTGLHATFAKAIFLQGGQYGVMMLSREKPTNVVQAPLPGKEPRVLLLCEFSDCVVGTTHLSVAAESERTESVELIRKAIVPFVGKKPVFLTGDWNAVPESAVLKGLGAFLKVVSDTDCQTYHGRQENGPDGQPLDMSKFCIDYIACDTASAGRFKVTDAHVVEDRTTSDHAPIVVTMETPDAARPRPAPISAVSSDGGASADGGKRPFLAINEDNDRYIISASSDPALLTERGARDYFDSVAAGGAVTHFFMCVNGQRTSYDSKVWEPIWLGVNDRTENGDTNNAWCVNARILHDRGVDIWKVWCARAREKGVSPWISMRMNDAHFVYYDYKVHRNESFWWEHPEWWRSPHTREERFVKTGRPRELDFSHPEVFDHALKLVAEILERWDADGIELDWMRQPFCLTAGKEAEQAHVLTDFMRQARKMADAAAKRRGHPVGVCVRVPSLLAGARLLGYDIETWAKEGLMDIIVPTSAYCAAEYDFGVADWRRALVGAPRPVKLVFGTDCCIYNHAVRRFDVYADDFSFMRGWAANAAEGDGYYIFNAPYYREPARSALYAGALAPELVAHGSRRYPITYHEWTPTKAMADNQMLRRSIGEGGEFHLNVRKYPHDRAFVLVFGVDQKDDPAPAITLNGVRPAEAPRSVSPKSVVPNPAGFETNPHGLARAWAWKFPSDVIRNGTNRVVVAPTKTAARAVWCEIMVKEPMNRERGNDE